MVSTSMSQKTQSSISWNQLKFAWKNKVQFLIAWVEINQNVLEANKLLGGIKKKRKRSTFAVVIADETETK